MKDLIALLPQPNPIITFHQVAYFVLARFNGNILRLYSLQVKKFTKQRRETRVPDKIFWESSKMKDRGVPRSLLSKPPQSWWLDPTVSQAVTALFRRIAGDAKIQVHLRLEIDSAFAKNSDIDSFTLSKPPYLDACIQETLRLMPPVAAGMMCIHN
ncbi:hypothetical protein BD779DRAFT_477423 [Infundibulicybe gibba]|nr:hypothetical protein BD779DRAFT_477423 [Infundibulicybe gibba]